MGHRSLVACGSVARPPAPRRAIEAAVLGFGAAGVRRAQRSVIYPGGCSHCWDVSKPAACGVLRHGVADGRAGVGVS